MSTIVLRQTKGSALTFAEGDANFTNLNNDKLEDITGENIGDLSDVDTTGITESQVLVWDSINSKFIAGNGFSGDYNDLTNKPTIPADTGDLTNGAGFISSETFTELSQDTTPALGGDLDGSNFEVSNVKLKQYVEPVYSLGAVSTSTVIDTANGNIQTYTNDGFQFNGFNNPQEGMSVTLVCETGSDSSGTFNIDGALTDTYYFGNDGASDLSTSARNIISIVYINSEYYISIAKGYM